MILTRAAGNFSLHLQWGSTLRRLMWDSRHVAEGEGKGFPERCTSNLFRILLCKGHLCVCVWDYLLGGHSFWGRVVSGYEVTILPFCSFSLPPDSTPLGSMPVGVSPFSVSTLSLSSLRRHRNMYITFRTPAVLSSFLSWVFSAISLWVAVLQARRRIRTLEGTQRFFHVYIPEHREYPGHLSNGTNLVADHFLTSGGCGTWEVRGQKQSR